LVNQALEHQNESTPISKPTLGALNTPDSYQKHQAKEQARLNTAYFPNQQRINQKSGESAQAQKGGTRAPHETQQTKEAMKMLEQ
jgi:hypothetical protein